MFNTITKIEDAIEILESLNDELLQNEEILKIKKIINDMQNLTMAFQ